jgi:hypothetical protein
MPSGRIRTSIVRCAHHSSMVFPDVHARSADLILVESSATT